MNCETVREMLWAYLEKETTAEEAVKIEEHLHHCAECRAELELQKEMMETLAGLPEADLPAGYHEELMQKLQAEAKVVPFPVKQKKQNRWKQLSLVAAAVLVIVAAGGMDGILGMRASQNEAVQEIKAADTTVPMPEVVEDAVETEEPEPYTAEVQKDTVVVQKKALPKPKKEETQKVPAKEVETEPPATQAELAAIPETASAATAEGGVPYAMTRSAKAKPTDKVTLQVEDTTVAKEALQKAIAEAGGVEEADTENAILVRIPMENYDAFIHAVEKIGGLDWTQKGNLEEDALWRMVELELK